MGDSSQPQREEPHLVRPTEADSTIVKLVQAVGDHFREQRSLIREQLAEDKATMKEALEQKAAAREAESEKQESELMGIFETILGAAEHRKTMYAVSAANSQRRREEMRRLFEGREG